MPGLIPSKPCALLTLTSNPNSNAAARSSDHSNFLSGWGGRAERAKPCYCASILILEVWPWSFVYFRAFIRIVKSIISPHLLEYEYFLQKTYYKIVCFCDTENTLLLIGLILSFCMVYSTRVTCF